jgi:predicted RNA binding protein YcfA (HicA-like mRNA interferase family)
VTQRLPCSIRKFARRVRREGWQARITNGGHIKFVHDDAAGFVIASASPSDQRAERNVLRDMRRVLGRDAP